MAASSSHPLIAKWGESGKGNGQFYNPQSLATDSDGNVYVTDLGNRRVQKFDNNGIFLKTWGTAGSQAGQFNSISGIAVDQNSVYVVDNQLNKIQKFDLDGKFVTQWGTAGNGPGQFALPSGIAIGNNGTILVADTGNHRIQEFSATGDFIKKFGSSGTSKGQFVSPIDITTDKEYNIYVADPAVNKITKFDSSGNYIKTFGPNIGGMPIRPNGIQIDPLGNLYVADGDNNRVLRLDPDGLTLTTFGSIGIADGQFKIAKDLTLGKFGNLFVIDTNGHRIQKFATPFVVETPQPTQQTTKQSTSTQTQTTSSVNPLPNDFTKPTIIPPNNLLIEATGGLTPVSVGQAMAHDESGIQSLSSNAPAEFPIGITTVIWTAIDGAGNMAIATQTVTVSDTTPPTISSPPDISIEAKSPTQNTVELIPPTATDNVGVISVTNNAPKYFPIGETIVMWTATDVMGNEAYAPQSVKVFDKTKPTIHAPANVVVEATSFDKNEIYLGEATVIDNGEILSITNDAPKFFKIGETSITWITSDASGNTATASQLVSVIDTTPPTIAPPKHIVFEATSASGNIVDIGTINATDVQQVSIKNNAPSTFAIGESIVIWNVTDASGNSATAQQTVSVVDTTPPSITITDTIIKEATGLTGNIVSLSEILVEDISEISSISNNAPQTFPFGNTTVTWTVTDSFGNVATKKQIISIIDTTPPKIIPPKDLIIEAVSAKENFADLGQPSVDDKVEIASVSNNAPNSFPIGMTTVNWEVSDTSGNFASASQIISVVDTTPPTIIPPSNVTAEATGPNGTSVSIGNATVSDIIGVSTITNNAPSVFPIGDTIVTWTANDTSGNISKINQTISVVDSTIPSIIAPPNIVIEATHPLENTVDIGVATASDIVGIVSLTNNAPQVFPVGDTIVTWTATDAAGNSANITQTISVVDTTAPKLIIPSAKTVEATGPSGNVVDYGVATATDLVGVTSLSNDAPETFPFGLTSITWTASDAAGNVANAIQQIFVVDTTLPTIEKPSDIVVEAQSVLNNTVTLVSPNVTDAVGIGSVTNNAPKFFSLGETIVTWTATDTSGNSANSTQIVSIVDTTPPSILAQSDITLEASSANENIVSLVPPTTKDTISDVTVTHNGPSLFPLGETIITWTATDAAGNSATSNQKITIIDTTPPKLTIPQNVIIDATGLETQVSIGNANSTDLTDSAPSITNNAPQTFPLGKTLVTWTTIDSFGNSVSATQTIDVQACGKPISYYNIIEGTEEDDIITGTTLPDLIFAHGGDDIISGDKGNDCIFGGEGEDIIFGNEGNDGLNGGEGNDIIKGQSGSDVIIGGPGMDMIDGGDDVDSCVDVNKSDGDLAVKCES